MDNDKLEELSGKLLMEMAEGWKKNGFSDAHYIQIDPDKSPEAVTVLNLLKVRGQVRLLDNGSMWGFTAAGRQSALALLGL